MKLYQQISSGHQLGGGFLIDWWRQTTYLRSWKSEAQSFVGNDAVVLPGMHNCLVTQQKEGVIGA